MLKWYSKTERVFQKMGETNKSVLSLNKEFDLKKKVLFGLNVFKKPFSFDHFFKLFFYMGKKEFIMLCVFIIML